MRSGLLSKKNIQLNLSLPGVLKNSEKDWNLIEKRITEYGSGKIRYETNRIYSYTEVEIFLRQRCAGIAYKFIYQSGPLFVAYNFGLPVIATGWVALRMILL